MSNELMHLIVCVGAVILTRLWSSYEHRRAYKDVKNSQKQIGEIHAEVINGREKQT